MPTYRSPKSKNEGKGKALFFLFFSLFSFFSIFACSKSFLFFKEDLPARLFVRSYVNRVLRLRLRGETDKSSFMLFAFFYKFCGILHILFLNCVTVRRRLDNSKTKKIKIKGASCLDRHRGSTNCHREKLRN